MRQLFAASSLFPAAAHKILVSGTVTARLVAIDGPLKGSTFEISGDSFSIGRKPGSSIAFTDQSISRHHCTLHPDGDRYRLRDRDSQNGTFVNGIPIKDRLLANGDHIGVGTSIFVFLQKEADPLAGPDLPLRAHYHPGVPLPQHRLIGESPALRHVLEFIAKVAPMASPVLITGEKGTGKELAARAARK